MTKYPFLFADRQKLWNYITLFAQLSDFQKNTILFTTLHNDIRYLSQIISPKQLSYLDSIVYQLYLDCVGKASFYVEHCFKAISRHVCLTEYGNINVENWIQQIHETSIRITKQFSEDVFFQSVVRNYWLYSNGICPFLNYAFNQWIPLYDACSIEKHIRNSAEFAITYLYRLIPVMLEPTLGQFINQGAYCGISVNKIYNGVECIRKIPLNLAAKAFVNMTEARLLNIISKHKIYAYFPRFYRFDKDSSIIYREYIEGYKGDSFLVEKKSLLTSNQKDTLRHLYDLLMLLRNQLSVNLDIHPANFIWSEKWLKWYFIDVSPVPVIGSDYYPTDSFDEYYKKIWVERRQRMIYEPIRSIDLGYMLPDMERIII